MFAVNDGPMQRKGPFPVSFEGAILTYLHLANPAFAGGRPPANFAGNNELRLRVTTHSSPTQFGKQRILPAGGPRSNPVDVPEFQYTCPFIVYFPPVSTGEYLKGCSHPRKSLCIATYEAGKFQKTPTPTNARALPAQKPTGRPDLLGVEESPTAKYRPRIKSRRHPTYFYSRVRATPYSTLRTLLRLQSTYTRRYRCEQSSAAPLSGWDRLTRFL